MHQCWGKAEGQIPGQHHLHVSRGHGCPWKALWLYGPFLQGIGHGETWFLVLPPASFFKEGCPAFGHCHLQLCGLPSQICWNHVEPCGLQAGGWTRLLGFPLSRTRIVFRPWKFLFEFQACCYPVRQNSACRCLPSSQCTHWTGVIKVSFPSAPLPCPLTTFFLVVYFPAPAVSLPWYPRCARLVHAQGLLHLHFLCPLPFSRPLDIFAG